MISMFNYHGLPSAPAIGQEIHFKVIFIDKRTNKNQEHIDYTFTLADPEGNKIALQAPHSGWGLNLPLINLEKKVNIKQE
jgi:hypothetical protein